LREGDRPARAGHDRLAAARGFGAVHLQADGAGGGAQRGGVGAFLERDRQRAAVV